MCTGLITQVMFTMPLGVLSYDAVDGSGADENRRWMWTAASVLALRSPALSFDPTLPANFDGGTDEEDTTAGGASALSFLERYVEKLLVGSFADSPLFWHYAMRHVPSDSLACAKAIDISGIRPGTSRSNSYKLIFDNSAQLPDDSLLYLPAVELRGYAADALGGVPSECFCGWQKTPLVPASNSSFYCTLPEAICTDLFGPGSSHQCIFATGTDHATSTLKMVLDQWPLNTTRLESWPCPNLDFSDAWGIVPPSTSDAWLGWTGQTRFTSSISDVIAYGRAGLRIGNIDSIVATARKGGVWPTERIHPLESTARKANGNAASDVALDRCAGVIASTFNATHVAQDIVDDLFPVAQGVHESAPIAVCLRFSIEYCKLRILKMLVGRASTAARLEVLNVQMGNQEAVTLLWKRRCEAQLQFLGVCKGNAVFEMVPPIQHTDIECPFTILDDYDNLNYYITPGCAVFIAEGQSAQKQELGSREGGAFYNPCSMVGSNPCFGGIQVTLGMIIAQAQHTRLPFDPRAVGEADVLGTWPVEFTALDAAGNARLAGVARQLEAWRTESLQKEGVGQVGIPWRLRRAFVEQVVERGGAAAPGAAGNTRKPWGTAEGWAGSVPDNSDPSGSSDSAEFCDSIVDWWPEDWSKPVGYHVTVPCSKHDTGYRTFDAAFAVDRDANEGDIMTVVTMRYLHTALRDPTTFHSQFGTAGFCRQGNYGMPQFVTNTMRVCTLDAADDVEYDATVPVLPRFQNGKESFSSQEHCSETPYDVPWSIDSLEVVHPSMLSVGSAAFYRGELYSAGEVLYPLSSREEEVENTHPGVRDNSWGQSCTDGKLLFCDVDHPCVPLNAEKGPLQCVRNTCVLQMNSSPSCYRHSDCADQKMLCSGDGLCKPGTWQVENGFDFSINFELYATVCNSADPDQYAVDSYDMHGASPWEKIPDILEMYGMCSYRNWFEYLEFVDPSNATRSNLGKCADLSLTVGCDPESFDADLSLWWDTKRPHQQLTMPSLWNTGKFRVHPHACDRDYMHIKGTRGCAPVVHEDNKGAGIVYTLADAEDFTQAEIPRATIARTFSRFASDRHFVNMIGRHPFKDILELDDSVVKKWANYRKSGFLSVPNIEANDFSLCKNELQCRVDPFTYHGARVLQRQVTMTSTMSTAHRPVFREWSASDAAACGIFGILVDAVEIGTMCGSFDQASLVCCRLDRAVLPVYEVVCGGYQTPLGVDVTERLDRLVNACGTAAGSAESTAANGIISKLSVQSICKRLSVHSVQGAYLVSKSNDAREVQLKSVSVLLNSLLDEFSPTAEITQAWQYVRVVDCSLALYREIQKVTACSDTWNNPFCTSYHKAVPPGISNSGTVSSINNNMANRTSVYLVLVYSMQEVSFSWMHKCLYLHSRKFKYSGDIIKCSQWNTDRVPASDLLKVSFSDSPMEHLRRIEGGLTGSMFQDSVQILRNKLITGLQYYVDGKDVFKDRGGVTTGYNIQCYTNVAYIDSKLMKDLYGKNVYQDCMIQILNWVYEQKADPSTFSRKVGQYCYDGVEKSLATNDKTGYGPPLKTLQTNLLTENPTIGSQIIYPNFLTQTFNPVVAGGGLLVAEYSPAKMETAESLGDVSSWSASTDVSTPSGIFLEDVKERLPSCSQYLQGPKPVPFTSKFCQTNRDRLTAWRRKFDNIYEVSNKLYERGKWPEVGPCQFNCDYAPIVKATIQRPSVALINDIKTAISQDYEACIAAEKKDKFINQDQLQMDEELQRNVLNPGLTNIAQWINSSSGSTEWYGFNIYRLHEVTVNPSEIIFGVSSFDYEYANKWSTVPGMEVSYKYAADNKILGKQFEDLYEKPQTIYYNLRCAWVTRPCKGSWILPGRFTTGMIDVDTVLHSVYSMYGMNPEQLVDTYSDKALLSSFKKNVLFSFAHYLEGDKQISSGLDRLCLPANKLLSDVQPKGQVTYDTPTKSYQFKTKIPTGSYKCAFPNTDELKQDRAAAVDGISKPMLTIGSKTAIPWYLLERYMLGAAQLTTLDMSKVTYTIYAHLVKALLGQQSISAVYAVPKPLDFFDDHLESWFSPTSSAESEKFQDFDISPKRTFEINYAKVGFIFADGCYAYDQPVTCENQFGNWVVTSDLCSSDTFDGVWNGKFVVSFSQQYAHSTHMRSTQFNNLNSCIATLHNAP